MQSGISASQELQDAFNTLVSTPSQRGLLATISNETLVPLTTIASSSPSFTSDLDALQPHLQPNAAAYILLKLDAAAADGYAAVTYVPDAAPVRQKMLFAATRLTLVRELGVERFRETLFVTTREELTAAGWARHVSHTGLSAPLTEEEQTLRGVREAEDAESRGTGARKSHVSTGIALQLGEGLLDALRELKGGPEGLLVQVKIDTSSEMLLLDSNTSGITPASLSGAISSSEPRYSFYRYPSSDAKIIFLYTCPTASKIKERMMYASCRSRLVSAAEQDAELEIAKKLEASDPDEFSEDVLNQEFEEKKTETKGFARPKRPGRR